jgi:CheY-like chemotaxis protein
MNRSVIDNREKPGHRPRAAVTVRRASTAVNHARRSMAPNGSKVAGPKQRAEILLRNRNLKMARNAHAYDQAMPGMTGTELAEIVQQKRPDLPLLLATGYAENLPRLSRPYLQAQLQEHVDRLLTRRDLTSST